MNDRKTCILTFAAVVVCLSSAQAQNPALPTIPPNTFYVTNYGTIANGITTNTAAIQSAINAASAAGGGTVEFTPGTYLSGPITMKANINLQVDAGAILRMLPFGQYPVNWFTNNVTNIYFVAASFIGATNVNDVKVSGSGAIDGQGQPWWPWANTNNAKRPILIRFQGCNRQMVQNVTLSNSPMFHISVSGSKGNTTVEGVTIRAPASSANTDACDVSGTNILIRNCDISVGDDNFTCSGGTSGVLITNNTYGSGHGVSIGSYTEGGVSNITVINCTFNATDNGIRLKSQRGRGGLVQNCNYYNLSMTNVDWPLLIYSYYEYGLGTLTGVDPVFAATTAATNPSTLNSTTPIWRNITFSNITATVPAGRPPLMVWGLPEAPASNIVFHSVNISSSSTKVPGLYNATNLQFVDCSFTLPANINTFQFYNAQLLFTNSALVTNLLKLDGLTTNGVLNALSLYNVRAALTKTNAIDGAPLALGSSFLNVSNHLKLTHATPLSFTLGTNAATVNVRSNLSFDGTFTFVAGSGFTNGSYTIFTYGGALAWAGPTNASAPPGYNYAFDTNASGQVRLLVVLPAPPAPTNLVAAASNSIVRLSWSPVATATGYNLKRATTSAGPYLVLAPGVASTNFTDTAVSNTVTYFYVVSAVNGGGEGADSTQASATPSPSLAPVALSIQTSADQIQLAWPADHTGWWLQIQTNTSNVGISTNWMPLADSQLTNQVFLPIDPLDAAVFLRLVYP